MSRRRRVLAVSIHRAAATGRALRSRWEMLSDVTITNYRGFASYKLEGLTQVNLFVGKNNCGKTALLEGLHLLTSGGDPWVLEDAAYGRGEVANLSESGVRR